MRRARFRKEPKYSVCPKCNKIGDLVIGEIVFPTYTETHKSTYRVCWGCERVAKTPHRSPGTTHKPPSYYKWYTFDEARTSMDERRKLNRIKAKILRAGSSVRGDEYIGEDGKTYTYCRVCDGTGFSGRGTGYDSVCDNCGGSGKFPVSE